MGHEEPGRLVFLIVWSCSTGLGHRLPFPRFAEPMSFGVGGLEKRSKKCEKLWRRWCPSQTIHGTDIFTYYMYHFKKKTFMWGNIPVPWMIWKMECSQTILTPPMQTPQTPVLTSKFRGVLKQVSGNLTLPVDPKKKKKNDRILGAT